jgi:hypothetical protein
MAYLNANIPPIYCKIRREYLYDLKKHHGESEECVLFAIASISGRALLFHALLSNGAVYYRLPISAFFQKRFSRSEVPDMSVDELQLWNCFSYYPAVTHFDFLSEDNVENFSEKTNKNIRETTYSLWTGDTLTPTYSMSTILKFLKNISAHIFWSLATAIMLLSLIIGSFGIFLVILLKSISQTIKYKLRIGT